MDPENTQPQGEQQQTGQAPAAPQPSERTFTQGEVDRMIVERLAREKRKQPQPNQPSQPQVTSNPQPDDWREQFSDAIDEVAEQSGARIPLDLKKRLRGVFQAERPQDPTAWVRGWLETIGATKPNSAADAAANHTTTEATKATVPQPSAAVPPNLVAPAAVANIDEISDPAEMMKPANFDRLVAKYGANGARVKIANATRNRLMNTVIRPK
jgi:hypothetical protein